MVLNLQMANLRTDRFSVTQTHRSGTQVAELFSRPRRALANRGSVKTNTRAIWAGVFFGSMWANSSYHALRTVIQGGGSMLTKLCWLREAIREHSLLAGRLCVARCSTPGYREMSSAAERAASEHALADGPQ